MKYLPSFVKLFSLFFLFGFVSLASTVLNAAETDAAKPPRPNIVFILSDDQGYADTGFMGSKDLKTPALDSIAQSGAILKSHYVQTVCSPTRAALMTGRYASHTGVFHIVLPGAHWGLPLEERTLANALHDAGYETAICGKWHLGEFDPAFLPMRRGFDHQYGHWFGAIDYNTHARGNDIDWHRDDKPLTEEGYSTTLIAKEACRRIQEKAADKPLFLYVPFNAVHTPHQVPESYLEAFSHIKGSRRTYAAMVAAMDEGVGQIMQALKDKGIYDNTIVVFSSDNGGPWPKSPSSNTPLRAGKVTLFEGGVRACACVSWPGHIPAGQVIDEPIHVIDWYPSLVRLAGGTTKQNLPVDGLDIWPVLTEKAKSPHEYILHCGLDPKHTAILVGDWKLIRDKNRTLLYNLRDDLSEKTDLTSQQPEKVKELSAKIDQLLTGAEVAVSKVGKAMKKAKQP